MSWPSPSILKMVMKKINEDSKSYCHFYYLFLKNHVFSSSQTVGSSAVVFGKHPCHGVEYNQKTTQQTIKLHKFAVFTVVLTSAPQSERKVFHSLRHKKQIVIHNFGGGLSCCVAQSMLTAELGNNLLQSY